MQEHIKIFNLFFRGGSSPNNLIKESESFYIPLKNQSFAKALHQTFQDVYLAIIARITESDAVETIQIKKDGFTSIPEIAKKKSVLD